MQTKAPVAAHEAQQPGCRLRPAQLADVATLEALIARSGVGLSVGFYSDRQAAAVTRMRRNIEAKKLPAI
ncbi:hypothetical protein [Collimonas silvisoli]|uniref:hypothetical protein n=1 Tax=Collimonas silvisoli TaxID=2825884 RepID=UPI001B8BB7EB|nr:hypothetical protein [Collimonas silvisoli]